MSLLGYSIISVVVLTLILLFFSVNTITLRTFSRGRMVEAFRRTGSKNDCEKKVDELVDHSERLTLTCAVYRILCYMGILMLLFFVINGDHQWQSYLLSFVISALIFLVFSLAVPNALAKYAGEKIFVYSSPILSLFSLAAWPLLYLFRLNDQLVKRLAGVAQTTPEEDREEKQEEFLSGLEQHTIEGTFDEEEQEMIENVLELSETTVDEIMTPRTDMVAIDANSDLSDILETIISAGHSRLPVFEDKIDNIVGMVYAKDLLELIGKDLSTFNLRDKLRQPYFVPETKLVRVLLHEFQAKKQHMAIVLDEYGGTAGIITLEDIIEELVGEISDEHEQVQPEPIREIDRHTFEVDARMNLGDLNDEYDLDLPEDEDYDTIGGFVFSYLGYIPKTGEKLEYQRLFMTITAAEPRRIKTIKIQKPLEPESRS